VRSEDFADRAWRQVRRRQLTGFGILVSMAIVGPTFWREETWHRVPLIDQGGFLWLIPSILMGIGFFLGGAIAGFRRRRAKDAFWQGLAASTATIGVIFAADLCRRHSAGESLPVLVVAYWIGALFAAGLVGGLGAVSGRASAVKWRRRSRR
jgi:hypothetical protein